jgi:type II secretory pathway pseudopilin PulG
MKLLALRIQPDNEGHMGIGCATSCMKSSENMKCLHSCLAAFSLVEVTLALGVAAFCLIAVLGLLPTTLKTQQASIQQTTANQIISTIFSFLRADVRLPPGQENKVCGDDGTCDWGNLHGNWGRRALPDTLYFTKEGKQIALGGDAPQNAVYRATITYRLPPSETTALADIRVTWPAKVDPNNGGVPAGSVRSLIAVNR